MPSFRSSRISRTACPWHMAAVRSPSTTRERRRVAASLVTSEAEEGAGVGQGGVEGRQVQPRLYSTFVSPTCRCIFIKRKLNSFCALQESWMRRAAPAGLIEGGLHACPQGGHHGGSITQSSNACKAGGSHLPPRCPQGQRRAVGSKCRFFDILCVRPIKPK